MRRRAFTLIELLCVIGIIGILVASYLGVFPKALGKAKETSEMNAERQTNILMEIHEDEGR